MEVINLNMFFMIQTSFIEVILLLYTTNPTECSAAATERSTSDSDLESPVESH